MDPLTLINPAHTHLLLNHVPTVGTAVAIGLMLLALVRRNNHLKHVSLEVVFIVALATLPAYLTGVAAQASIEGREGVTQAIIDLHHDAALVAFVLMNIAGAIAWLALWQFRRRGAPAAWAAPVVLLLLVLTVSVMARAATLGGEIRHQEIRIEDAAPAVPGAGWLTKAGMQNMVTTYPRLRGARADQPPPDGRHEGHSVRGGAPAAAVGHARLRHEPRDRDDFLHLHARAVHGKRTLLLEDDVPDARGDQLSLPDRGGSCLQAGAGSRHARL
jgi:uncharacterized membrane protein